jgi:2-oxoglutarate dehydrogenase E2 component (dihydrolipoamide succinyltransferase)
MRVPMIANTGAKLAIGRWFKRAGDPVSLDEPLVEINTDKETHEIRAPVTGVLSKICCEGWRIRCCWQSSSS